MVVVVVVVRVVVAAAAAAVTGLNLVETDHECVSWLPVKVDAIGCEEEA